MIFESNLDELTDEQLIELNGGGDDSAFYKAFHGIGYVSARLVETIKAHPAIVVL